MDKLDELKDRVCEVERREANNKAISDNLVEMMKLHLAAQDSTNPENQTDANVPAKSTSDNDAEQKVVELLKELAIDKQRLIKSDAQVIELLNQLLKANKENEALMIKANEVDKRDYRICELQRKLKNSEEQIVKSKAETRELNVKKDALKKLNVKLGESKKVVAKLQKAVAKSARVKKLDDSKIIELRGASEAAIHRNIKLCDKLESSRQEAQKLSKEAEIKARRLKEIFEFFDEFNLERDRFVISLSDRAYEQFLMDQYEEASELWLKAVEIEKLGTNDANDLGVLWSNIAFCLYQLKRYEEALDAIETSIECGPPNAMRFYVRGVTQKELGKPAEAIIDLEKSLAMNPEHQRAIHAKALLIELKNSE
ncbi:hypothetical protein M3Y97_01022400 [Aphelenchoides bicaudatus]|nr:hypothetical protein M3Y97_01022400 [Aphelenchoides bicaudatus]